MLQSYRNDLSSDAAKKVQQQLRDMGLPTLPAIKDEVAKKAEELGVKSG